MAKNKKRKKPQTKAKEATLQSIAHQSRSTLFTRKVVSKKVYKRKPKHRKNDDWAFLLFFSRYSNAFG
ncbi:MAG TPA: hypothetical protein DCS93_11920 [Microscillaceae bacterium]|nr:hypothetical protein [Microscillaceae bacterium]